MERRKQGVRNKERRSERKRKEKNEERNGGKVEKEGGRQNGWERRRKE